MKVTMPKDYRDIFTLAEYDYAKQIIAEMKDDLTPVKDYAEMAVRAFCNYGNRCEFCQEILKASAEVSKNGRKLFPYSDSMPHMDIWVSAIAQTDEGFLEIHCYLSDIWALSADDESKWNLISHAYIRHAVYKS